MQANGCREKYNILINILFILVTNKTVANTKEFLAIRRAISLNETFVLFC